jgi:hypothetical protein
MGQSRNPHEVFDGDVRQSHFMKQFQAAGHLSRGATFCARIANMKNEFLASLLGSHVRARLLRLFVFNKTEQFTAEEAMKRAQVNKKDFTKEIKLLEKIGIVKKKNWTKEESRGRGKGKKIVKRKVSGWTVQESNQYIGSLTVFLRSIAPAAKDGVTGRLTGVGKMKLIALAGALCDDDNSRVDLLVVGDKLDDRKLQAALRAIEADIGAEVRYAAFTTEEFHYRLNVYDKLVRDVFEYPHEILLDRLDVVAKLGL